ncbi:MAG TPA: hypothetical protein VG295_10400 [Solirubrobacteraceae bacterium]|nr:hypothetical protein [Solirubrobacteraceae bacterium]
MTEDRVALDDWYPVADALPARQGPAGRGPADAFTTRLLGHPLRVAFAGGRARITALRGDGHELRELPVTERFGLVWTTLGRPAKEVYDLPEAHEAGRRYVRCGWVTLRTSAPRIVENFLDMAHFPFVHPGVLGSEPWTEVADYEAEIRRDVDEVWASLHGLWASALQRMQHFERARDWKRCLQRVSLDPVTGGGGRPPPCPARL